MDLEDNDSSSNGGGGCNKINERSEGSSKSSSNSEGSEDDNSKGSEDSNSESIGDNSDNNSDSNSDSDDSDSDSIGDISDSDSDDGTDGIYGSDDDCSTEYFSQLDDYSTNKESTQTDPQETAKKLVTFLEQKEKQHVLIQNGIERLAEKFVEGIETQKKLASFLEFEINEQGDSAIPTEVRRDIESLVEEFVGFAEKKITEWAQEFPDSTQYPLPPASVIDRSLVDKVAVIDRSLVDKAAEEKAVGEVERELQWKETKQKLVFFLSHKREYSNFSLIRELDGFPKDFVEDIENAFEKSSPENKHFQQLIDCQEEEKPQTTTKKLISFVEQKSKYHVLVQSEIEWLAEKFVKDAEKMMKLWEEKCLPIIEQKMPLPVHIRTKRKKLIEELEEEGVDSRKPLTATLFLREIEKIAHVKVLRSYSYDVRQCPSFDGPAKAYNVNDNDYFGLDSDRDTEEEVENMIRLVPDAAYGFPGLFRCDSVQDVAFIPLLLRLRMEIFKWWPVDELGGLLIWTNLRSKLLHRLVMTDDKIEEKDLLDDRLLDVIRRLKNEGILQKTLIQNKNLVIYLIVESNKYFPEKRFRFLVNWDPDVLKRKIQDDDDMRDKDGSDDGSDDDGCRALHIAAWRSTLRGFQLVFEAGVRYFPKMKGINLLFHSNEDGETPFEIACERHGPREVNKAIESVLTDCSDKPYNAIDALLLAASEDYINLHGVYFLLRREPDVLAKLLTPSSEQDVPSFRNGSGVGNGGTVASGSKKRKADDAVVVA